MKPRLVVCLFAVAAAGGVKVASFGVGQVAAQEYPARPLRIITSPAGGGNDFPARLIARMGKVLRAAGMGIK